MFRSSFDSTADASENQPLLEHEQYETAGELTELIIEQHPDDIHNGAPQQAGQKRSLYADINACIARLDNIIAAAAVDQQDIKHQRYGHLAALLTGSALVMAAPGTFMGVMLRHWHDLYNTLVITWREQLAGLQETLNNAGAIFDYWNQQYESTLSALVSTEITEWLNTTREAFIQNCESCAGATSDVVGTCAQFHVVNHPERIIKFTGYGMTIMGDFWDLAGKLDWQAHRYMPPHNDIFATFCYFSNHANEQLFLRHPISICSDIAVSACRTISNYTAANPAFGDITTMTAKTANYYNSIQFGIEHLANLIDTPYTTNPEVAIPYAPALFTGAFLFAASIVAYLGYKAATGRGPYRDKLAHTHDIDNCIRNPDDAVAIINIATNLGIDTQGMQVTDLRTRLIAERDNIDALWKRRAAFLSARKDPCSTLFTFFNSPGSADVQKKILEYAELRPARTVRP